MTRDGAPPSRGATPKAAQDLSDAEFGELDDLLAAIPEPLDPLDAVALDGFLAALVVLPRLVEVERWLPLVFDAGGHRWGEAEPGPEQRRARELVLRRHAALGRSLAEHASFDPYLLIDPEAPDDVDAVVGPWLDGFEQAVEVFASPQQPHGDDGPGDELGALPSVRGAASVDAAIAALVDAVGRLYLTSEAARFHVDPVRRTLPKVGRNDPCPCGSGRKWKQCHGAPGAAAG